MKEYPKTESLTYHQQAPSGKIAITVTKPASTQHDLSIAYSPGVADPCLAIAENPEASYDYTWRSHTVAVISDGSAVLGLGNIGGLASLPVMEGKALLFKKFADIDAVPVILEDVRDANNKPNVEKITSIIKSIAATYGGINLEDIAAPYCFEIEDALQDIGIPVFHDDQHGTAIVACAGMLNSLLLTKKKIECVKIVVNGAGAAGIRIVEMLRSLGVSTENITTCDSRGVIYTGRANGMNQYKERIAISTNLRTLSEAMKDSDIFIGVSKGNILNQEMIASMNTDSAVFALANPEPEIMPDLATKYGTHIIATGRSDFPNQVNNVLGFPGLFKAALQMRLPTITHDMKIAAVHAIAEIAREPFPESIRSEMKSAYPDEVELFDQEHPLSPSYIIPKPTDPRVVERIVQKIKEQ